MEKAPGTQPCLRTLQGISSLSLHSILSRLAVERIEEKAARIEETFTLSKGRWDDTLFRTLIRSAGFGIQSSIFQEWAGILNMQALEKHRDSSLQIEAVMFGQAGLLNEESIPHYYRAGALASSYYKELLREYKFLKNKFSLSELPYTAWGTASPHLRIARLAALFFSRKLSISSISECGTITALRRLFDAPLSVYWSNHLCFGGTETAGNGSMKSSQTDVLIINTVVPFLYLYGKHRKDEQLCSRAEDLLYSLASEENGIIRRWRERGINADCAAHSQAIIQLDKQYCRQHRCAECLLGRYIIIE